VNEVLIHGSSCKFIPQRIELIYESLVLSVNNPYYETAMEFTLANRLHLQRGSILPVGYSLDDPNPNERFMEFVVIVNPDLNDTMDGRSSEWKVDEDGLPILDRGRKVFSKIFNPEYVGMQPSNWKTDVHYDLEVYNGELIYSVSSASFVQHREDSYLETLAANHGDVLQSLDMISETVEKEMKDMWSYSDMMTYVRAIAKYGNNLRDTWQKTALKRTKTCKEMVAFHYDYYVLSAKSSIKQVSKNSVDGPTSRLDDVLLRFTDTDKRNLLNIFKYSDGIRVGVSEKTSDATTNPNTLLNGAKAKTRRLLQKINSDEKMGNGVDEDEGDEGTNQRILSAYQRFLLASTKSAAYLVFSDEDEDYLIENYDKTKHRIAALGTNPSDRSGLESMGDSLVEGEVLIVNDSGSRHQEVITNAIVDHPIGMNGGMKNDSSMEMESKPVNQIVLK
jgi:hypothetical protein